jgi:quercetin dioxygenase-like cupin family protein
MSPRALVWSKSEANALRRFAPGTRYSAEPGEWHWHDAGTTTFMTHLAVQQALDGAGVEWGDLVSDEHPV